MKLSLAWLRDLVELPPDPAEVCDRLTTLGVEVEAVAPFVLAYPGVVVGHVLETRPHPAADRLTLCRVSTGSEELPIVCGAKNVRPGLTVAVALPGAELPGGISIRKSKIRGEVSAGMICSEKELGIGQAHEGILELDTAALLGHPLDELFGVKDVTIEVEVTPNRPDWLSHVGVARELAAFYRRPLRLPEVAPLPPLQEALDGWRAQVEDPEGCTLYTGRMLRGVSAKPSPLWLRHRLLAIGQRPINLLVDCSNYVLHEGGHPNHVFDRARLRGSTIAVRRARAGESVTTLDGVERALLPHHLVIADAEGAVALAGVMGGAGSQVTAETSELVLEVARFDPATVRRMRKDLGLSTDASYRFERGVDSASVPAASARLAQLITSLAGGSAASAAFVGRGAAPPPPARFFVRAAQVSRVLGVPIAPEASAEILQRLSIEASVSECLGLRGVDVVQPSFRADLLEEVDAIEEIARQYGYDQIPARDQPPLRLPAQRSVRERLFATVRPGLAARGYREVICTSFMEAKDVERLGLPADDARRRFVEVRNPLVAGEGHLRTTALPEMLRVLSRNRRRGLAGPLRLFQLDRCFLARADQQLPAEPEHLDLLWAGPAEVPHATRVPRPVDLQDALGEVTALLETLGLSSEVEPAPVEPFHAAGQSLRLHAQGVPLGTVGALGDEVRVAFELDEPVLFAQIELAALVSALPQQWRFAPLSPYPPVHRDLSLIVPKRVPYAAVSRVVRGICGELLESLDVFDLYEGEGIASDCRALGVRLALRSPDATLKDRRVDGLISTVLAKLKEQHGIQLRS